VLRDHGRAKVGEGEAGVRELDAVERDIQAHHAREVRALVAVRVRGRVRGRVRVRFRVR